ncbi:hypothetical protein WK66_10600 [Burkholderia ubonensis]|uniref:Uncharacterized protein n=1 Tax=Burkholderia ubonensis TaxID=101571 RepID=A0ABD4E0N8_9BURK|nr:hypothetical protein WJ68_15425 [Burkholderia ubonensis]KVU27378.1 hypothetical protein WK66_10600 [Burkholderia ubonensis]
MRDRRHVAFRRFRRAGRWAQAGHAQAGRVSSRWLEMVEQESRLRRIVQRRAGRQQRGAAQIVDVEAERRAGQEIVVLERDEIVGSAHRGDADEPREAVVMAVLRQPARNLNRRITRESLPAARPGGRLRVGRSRRGSRRR